jgi:hypothetical protein
MEFGLIIGFIEDLLFVTLSNYNTITNSLQHILCLLSLLCLHHSLSASGFQLQLFPLL